MHDVDMKGEIGRDQLRNLLQSVDSGRTSLLLTEHWLSEDELDSIMEAYDADKSGTINFEEFTRMVTDGLLLDGLLTEYEDAFHAVDRTGNGTIGAMELSELFKNLGREMTCDKLSGIMEKYDKDGSGQIEFHEFLPMFRDQLLDLKEVQNYLSNDPSLLDSPKSQDVLHIEEGGVSLIFSEKEMEEAMQQKDKLVLVYVALTWCRPCKGINVPLSRMAQHYKDSYVFIKLFGNSNVQTKRLFNDILKVSSTPCFMIFKGKELLHTQLGPNREKLEDALRNFVPEGRMPIGRLYFPQN